MTLHRDDKGESIPSAYGDPEADCGCGHPMSQHAARTGECGGVGAWLDGIYGIPPDEACACRKYEAIAGV